MTASWAQKLNETLPARDRKADAELYRAAPRASNAALQKTSCTARAD
jgi:hypothetical protein